MDTRSKKYKYKITLSQLENLDLQNTTNNFYLKEKNKKGFFEVGESYQKLKDLNKFCDKPTDELKSQAYMYGFIFDVIDRDVKCGGLIHLGFTSDEKSQINDLKSHIKKQQIITERLMEVLNLNRDEAEHIIAGVSQGYDITNILSYAIAPTIEGDPFSKPYGITAGNDHFENIFKESNGDFYLEHIENNYKIFRSTNIDETHPFAGETRALFKFCIKQNEVGVNEWGLQLVSIETDSRHIYAMLRGRMFKFEELQNKDWHKAYILSKLPDSTNNEPVRLFNEKIQAMSEVFFNSDLDCLDYAVDCVNAVLKSRTSENLFYLYQSTYKNMNLGANKSGSGLGMILFGGGCLLATGIGLATGGFSFVAGLAGSGIVSGGFFSGASAVGVGTIAKGAINVRDEKIALAELQNTILGQNLQALLLENDYTTYATTILKIIKEDARNRGKNIERDHLLDIYLTKCENYPYNAETTFPLFYAGYVKKILDYKKEKNNTKIADNKKSLIDELGLLVYLYEAYLALTANSSTSQSASELMKGIDRIEQHCIQDLRYDVEDERAMYHAFINIKLDFILEAAKLRSGENMKRISTVSSLKTLASLDKLQETLGKTVTSLSYYKKTTEDLKQVLENLNLFLNARAEPENRLVVGLSR